jgi:hypothetical protein
MNWQLSGLRKVSEVKDATFPFKSPMVVFIRIRGGASEGEVLAAERVTDKQALLEGLKDGDLLLATWPGQYRQDAFIVDDWNAARAAFSKARRE